MIQAIKTILRFLGIDRAVFFSNATQLLRLVTGPVTMVLVLRYLTPEIQGYFYTFSGIVAMQIFLEMGFSQNILQFTSHEFAKLRFTPAMTLEGDPEALSRLISLGRLAFRYYGVASLLMVFVVGIGGHLFFTLSGDHGVTWQGAWWIVSVAASLSLAINPVWSLLEGCNQVAKVAQFRLWMTIAGFAVNAAALIAGTGIYVAAIVAVFTFLFSVGYFFFFWRSFLGQFLTPPQHGKVSWYREIWPFQWRIAVSWMSGYFIFSMVNPVAFFFCGAVEAGRFGMSFQLVRMVSSIAGTWINTKTPRFGMLIASKNWKDLDSLWRRSTLLACGMCALGMLLLIAAIPIAGHFIPKVPLRLAPLGATAWLAGAMTVQVLIVAMANALRAHKREPYMGLSIANAVLSILFVLPMTHYWGIWGESVGFTLAIWAIFFPAVRIYRAKRLEYRNLADSAPEVQTLVSSDLPSVS